MTRDAQPAGAQLPARVVGGRSPRVGLVLAGGGARGCYQLGVLEYFVRHRMSLSAVAGASIGALNAAVIAAAPDLPAAADSLAAVWEEVGRAADRSDHTPGRRAQATDLIFDNHVAREPFLKDLLSRHVDPHAVRDGLPLWVSVFPSPPGLGWIGTAARARTSTAAQPTWLHVNVLPLDEIHTALQGSAALPGFIPPQEVAGKLYRDGGITDNIPIGALLAHADCDLFLVVHLNRGSLWDARDYASGRILEIRPTESLHAQGVLGGLISMLDFSAERASWLRRLGFEDAERALGSSGQIFTSVTALRTTQAMAMDELETLERNSND